MSPEQKKKVWSTIAQVVVSAITSLLTVFGLM